MEGKGLPALQQIFKKNINVLLINILEVNKFIFIGINNNINRGKLPKNWFRLRQNQFFEKILRCARL